MLVALDKYGKRVEAEYGIKKEAYCPSCNERLDNKVNGEEKRPHFAHKHNTNCDYGKGESEAHLECKIRLKNLIEANNDFSISGVEYWLEDGFICDYYVELESGERIIFEIVDKNTDLSLMQEYNGKNGFYVCLIFLDNYERGKDIRIGNKELLVHNLCNGRIYTFDFELKRWWSVHFSRDQCSEYTGKQIRHIHKKPLRDFKITFNNYFKVWW